MHADAARRRRMEDPSGKWEEKTAAEERRVTSRLELKTFRSCSGDPETIFLEKISSVYL